MTIAEERLQDQVAALIQEREDGARAAQLLAVAAASRHRQSSEGADPDAVFHEIASAFELVAARGRRPAAVRAYNPAEYECLGSVVEATTDDLPYLVDSVAAE